MPSPFDSRATLELPEGKTRIFRLDTLLKASRALRDAEVVLGPACDGGYYLIGMRNHHPELFGGIPWGTARVFAATRTACAAAGLTPVLLPELRDVDRVEDLTALGLWPR